MVRRLHRSLWPHHPPLCPHGSARAAPALRARSARSGRTQEWLATRRGNRRRGSTGRAASRAGCSLGCRRVRDDLLAHLGDEASGVLIVDETGFLKKGDKSCGVGRQYTGTAGDTVNAQVGVFLAYASDKGAGFIDRALYLPREWTSDRGRRKRARPQGRSAHPPDRLRPVPGYDGQASHCSGPSTTRTHLGRNARVANGFTANKCTRRPNNGERPLDRSVRTG